MAAKKRSYGPKAGAKVEKAMHERKHGTLRSGRSGKKVTSKKQAIAIGLSEARENGAKVPKKRAGAKSAKKRSGAKKTASAKERTTAKKASPAKNRTTAKKGSAKKSGAAKKRGTHA